METAPYYATTTDFPDPDAMAPRPALAVLTKHKRVKLRLSEMAFGETTQFVGAMVSALNKDVDNQPWLDMSSVRSRAGLALLLDLYEGQMQPYALACPDLVTLTLSRAEAHIVWELWVLLDISTAMVPALAAVMHELHLLLS